MSGMTGMELRFESGTDSEGRLSSSTKSCAFIWARRERERGDFFVKTDWNCRLHRLALTGVSVKRVSFSFRGGLPSLSPLEFFRKEKSFFLSQMPLSSESPKRSFR